MRHGFGSMAAGHGERLSGIAVRALRAAGLRGILQSGSAGLAAEGDDDVLTVGDVPHALLFPRTAAVVHHAGAGTAAAGLRAGVPAVPVPVTADQPFWALRLAALGAASRTPAVPVPRRRTAHRRPRPSRPRPRIRWLTRRQLPVPVQSAATWPSRTRCGWSPTGTDTTFCPVAKSIAVTWSAPLSEITQSFPSPLTVAQ